MSTRSASPGPCRERLVAGPVDVTARSPRDLGHDVLLELTGADGHDAPRAVARGGGRDVAPAARPFPGEPGAPATELAGGLACGGEPPDAVLEHRPRRRGMGCGEERQHECVGVPEHVTAVRRSAEAAGADGRFGPVTDRRHQLEQREARRNLQLVVALDDDVGVLPPARPGGAVLGEQPIEAD